MVRRRIIQLDENLEPIPIPRPEPRRRSPLPLNKVREEYENLMKVYHGLTGNLYPSIAYKDLLALRDEYAAGGGTLSELSPLDMPNLLGYAPAQRPRSQL